MENIFRFLDKLGFSYKVFEHPAVFTVEDAKQHRIPADFGECKNLFLRNRKGDTHYLVTLPADKKLNLIKLEGLLDEDLSFASPERLKKYLDLTPGSVSPFGLINDLNKEVVFVLDSELLKQKYLGFHPNVNTQTIVLLVEDFKKFLENTGNKIIFFEL